MKTNNSLTGDNMNEYTPKKNSINDVITEKKQLDGDEIIIQKKINFIRIFYSYWLTYMFNM